MLFRLIGVSVCHFEFPFFNSLPVTSSFGNPRCRLPKCFWWCSVCSESSLLLLCSTAYPRGYAESFGPSCLPSTWTFGNSPRCYLSALDRLSGTIEKTAFRLVRYHPHFWWHSGCFLIETYFIPFPLLAFGKKKRPKSAVGILAFLFSDCSEI